MNLRMTTLLFGLLLGTLWIFGLILAMGRSALDPGFVLPKFAKDAGADITTVEILKDGKTYCVFVKGKEGWRLKLEGQAQDVRADEGEVDSLIDEIRRARHSNEETDVALNRNLKTWGLDAPKYTVILRAGDNDPWKIFVGKESEDKLFAFVNSSERPGEVLAVKRAALSKVFVEDMNKFRLRRLFNAKELTTRKIDIRENRDGKVSELALEKIKDKQWWFKTPAMGPADLEPAPASKFEPKLDEKAPPSSKSLLASLANLRIEDFEPIGSAVTVDDKNPLLRIELSYESSEPSKDDKGKGNLKTDVLLVGNKVRGDKDQYFARMADDNSVVIINGEQLKPVFDLVADPKPLRSRDISFFELDSVDAVEIQRGNEFAKLFREKGAWDIFSSDAKPKAGSDSAITGSSGILMAILGKQAIGENDFENIDTKEKREALEAKFAADKLDARVTVWADSLLPRSEKKDEKKAEPEKKDEKKAEPEKKDVKGDDKKEPAKTDVKDEQKTDKKDAEKKDQAAGDKKAEDKKLDPQDDKKADQKTDKPGDQKAADKKDDKQADKTPLSFKEGARPLVTLSFVKLDKDKYLVKRELPSEEPSADKDKKDVKVAVAYFTLPTATYEKIVPDDLALALYDTEIKTFAESDAVKVELSRAPVKDREKMLETFVFELEPVKDKDKTDAVKKDAAKDDKKADEAKKLDPAAKDEQKKSAEEKKEGAEADKKKDEPVKYEWKLREPKEFAGKGKIDTAEIDRVLRRLADLKAERWVKKASPQILEHYRLDDKQWTVRVVVTPKKKEEAKDPKKDGAKDEKKEAAKDDPKEELKPFILRIGEASTREADKGAVFAYVEGTDYVFVVDSALEKLLKEVEFRDRQVLEFKSEDVKELRVFIKTEKEDRKPVFELDKDKVWKDKKETLGFKIDSSRVQKLVDRLANLKVERYLGVKGDLPKDFELGDAAPLKFEVLMKDDKTVHTITVGSTSEKNGPYYAISSSLPGHVFLLSRDPFSELMGKVTYFRKD